MLLFASFIILAKLFGLLWLAVVILRLVCRMPGRMWNHASNAYLYLWTASSRPWSRADIGWIVSLLVWCCYPIVGLVVLAWWRGQLH